MKTKARVWKADEFQVPKDFHVLIDTNVWLYMHMEEATQNFTRDGNVANDYMEVIGRLLEGGATLHFSCFSFCEIAHVIENYFYELYKANLGREFPKKRYRHDLPRERLKVVTKIQEVWSAVVATGVAVADYPVAVDAMDGLVADFRNFSIDSYDLFMLDSMRHCNCSFLLTNDGDFLSVPNLDVLTLSRSALEIAEEARILRK